MQPGDRVKVYRYLTGQTVTLMRRHHSGAAWTCKLDDGHVVMLWDYELKEILPRPERKRKGRK